LKGGKTMHELKIVFANEEEALEAVKRDGSALKYIPRNLKTPELCLEAMKSNGLALQYVPKKLRTAKVCLEAIKQNY
jgi:hypothetical protein